MQVGVIGVNHKSAPLPLREAFALACSRRWGGGQLPLYGEISYVLLSTCNRSELYFSSGDLVSTHGFFVQLLRQELKCEFEHALYSYFEYECFFHLSCVTAGLDSAIRGETEIQGQVKREYELAAKSRFLSKAMHFMFQKSLKISKNIRNSHSFPSGQTLEATIYNEGKSYFSDLKNCSILFIGDSQINHKIISYFKRRKLQNIFLCNRSNESASVVCQEEKIGFVPWEMKDHWPKFDMVIVATKSAEYLITPPLSFPSHRKLLIDLSLPRNIDPNLSIFPFRLLNIDDLQKNISLHLWIEKEEVSRIKYHHISQAVRHQMDLFQKKEEIAQLVFA